MIHLRFGMPLWLMALYGSAAILLVFLLRGTLKKRLPAVVLPVLWGFALVRLLVPFSLSSPISAPVPAINWGNSGGSTAALVQDSGTAYGQYTANAVTAQPAQEIVFSHAGGGSPVTGWLTVYLLGLLVTAGILFIKQRRCRVLLSESLLVEQNVVINDTLADLGVRALVFTNDRIASPLVSGIFRPGIYLPAGMNFQNQVLVRHVIAHEACHIRRKDNLLKLVMVLTLCLYWFNPLVWLMARYLSADIEAACDAAVLKREDSRQYAYSLLGMSVGGGRDSLLYSAFSKSEVERRITGVLRHKKLTAVTAALSAALLLLSGAVFASGGQAPFEQGFSATCANNTCGWAVKANLTRDINPGKDAYDRANRTILDVMDKAEGDPVDPDKLKDAVLAALSREFGVEKRAFSVNVSLLRSDEELAAEYQPYGLAEQKRGGYQLHDEKVRFLKDEMLGRYSSDDSGTVDVVIHRDRLGAVTEMEILRRGDPAYDERTKELERQHYLYEDNQSVHTRETLVSGTAVEDVKDMGRSGNLHHPEFKP